MISKKLSKKIEEASGNELALTKEEKAYAEKRQLLTDGLQVVEKDKKTQFNDAEIERFNKETEETISKDSIDFLQTALSHFKENKNEFLYMESPSFDMINVDAIAVEYDEVFEVYTAMFGLSLLKKFGPAMKEYLDDHFQSETMNYSIMFSGPDGLWEVNLPLSYISEFNEAFTLEETFHFLYTFIFALVESTENK